MDMWDCHVDTILPSWHHLVSLLIPFIYSYPIILMSYQFVIMSEIMASVVKHHFTLWSHEVTITSFQWSCIHVINVLFSTHFCAYSTASPMTIYIRIVWQKGINTLINNTGENTTNYLYINKEGSTFVMTVISEWDDFIKDITTYIPNIIFYSKYGN